MKQKLSLIMLLTCIVLLLVACGQTAEQPTEAAAEQPADEVSEDTAPAEEGGYECPERGGVLKMNYPLPADRIGVPKNIIHYNQFYAGAAIESLIRGGVTTGYYDPILATDWKIADDKSYIEFYLREGVKFHDDSDFNADVAKWNMDMLLESGTPLLRAVSSFEVIDDYTLRVNLDFYDVTLIADIGRNGMISQEAFEANGEEWADYNPVGTGPFKLVKFEREQILQFEAFEDYWNPGLPCLDGIEYTQVPDGMTAMAMIQAEEVKVLFAVIPPVVEQLKGLLETPVIDNFVGLHMVIEMNDLDPDSIWSDVRMRQALEYAIDKEGIVEATGFGLNHPVYEIIHSLHDSGGNPDTTPRMYDPDKARELIAEAGYADGFTVQLTYGSNVPQDSIVIMQSNLADVGINLELNPVDPVALNQMSFEPPEGSSLRFSEMRGGGEPTGSVKETLAEGSIYYPGVSRPEGFQDLLDLALQEEDVEARLALLSQAEELLYNDAVLIPLWNSPLTTVDDGSIGDIYYSYGGTPTLVAEKAYLKP